jgi:predicted nucleic acid-binding protein
LFALCQKHRGGLLTDEEYDDAVDSFATFMKGISSPPSGEADLVKPSALIGAGYGCSHSADSVYLALAAQMSSTRPATLLTFDGELLRHAARKAPGVHVRLL